MFSMSPTWYGKTAIYSLLPHVYNKLGESNAVVFELKGKQAECMKALLENNDLFSVFPTGYGLLPNVYNELDESNAVVFELKGKQAECINALLENNDMFSVLPTRYGETTIYGLLPHVYNELDESNAVIFELKGKQAECIKALLENNDVFFVLPTR